MCNRLTKLSLTMWYTFFGIFDDTSLWILPKTHDPSLCDTPDDMWIRWRQTTWVVLVPITIHIPSFSMYPIQNSGYLTFLLLANQNRYANEVLNLRIQWQQTAWVVLVPPTTHTPSLTKIGHCVLIWEQMFTFWCWRDLTNIHPSVRTFIHTYRQRYKWKLNGPSSIAGSPQKKKLLFSFIFKFQFPHFNLLHGGMHNCACFLGHIFRNFSTLTGQKLGVLWKKSVENIECGQNFVFVFVFLQKKIGYTDGW